MSGEPCEYTAPQFMTSLVRPEITLTVDPADFITNGDSLWEVQTTPPPFPFCFLLMLGRWKARGLGCDQWSHYPHFTDPHSHRHPRHPRRHCQYLPNHWFSTFAMVNMYCGCGWTKRRGHHHSGYMKLQDQFIITTFTTTSIQESVGKGWAWLS